MSKSLMAQQGQPVPSTQEMRGQEFVVEAILDKRVDDGGIFYLIKWEGFGDEECTWEPEKNLAKCPELVEEFNDKSENERRVQKEQEQLEAEPEPECTEAVGFDRGLLPQKIIGATDCTGELYFLIKWDAEGSYFVDLVPAKEANQKCPDVVIKFYEERLCWED